MAVLFKEYILTAKFLEDIVGGADIVLAKLDTDPILDKALGTGTFSFFPFSSPSNWYQPLIP